MSFRYQQQFLQLAMKCFLKKSISFDVIIYGEPNEHLLGVLDNVMINITEKVPISLKSYQNLIRINDFIKI